jgi:hypothetical protein
MVSVDRAKARPPGLPGSASGAPANRLSSPVASACSHWGTSARRAGPCHTCGFTSSPGRWERARSGWLGASLGGPLRSCRVLGGRSRQAARDERSSPAGDRRAGGRQGRSGGSGAPAGTPAPGGRQAPGAGPGPSTTWRDGGIATVGTATQPLSEATELPMLADGGESNGARSRAWKHGLQRPAGCPGSVSRSITTRAADRSTTQSSTGHSKISKNWAGQPLRDYETVVNYISTTATKTGLRVDAHLRPPRPV